MKFYLTKRRSKKSGKVYTALVAMIGEMEIYLTFDRYAINQIARIQGVKLSDMKEDELKELILV